MSKRIKTILAILCVILVLMTLLSFFIAALSAFHVCRRKSCPICRFIDMVLDIQKTTYFSYGQIKVLLTILLIINFIYKNLSQTSLRTPVELMVRMNN